MFFKQKGHYLYINDKKNMEYSVTHFYIDINYDELMQSCRELLADCVSEAGYESFEDTSDGINGYIQTQYYDPELTAKLLDDFPIEAAHITFKTEEVESQNWNEEYESVCFEPIVVGNNCIIYDAMSEDADKMKSEHEISIAIDQRMAFGNGQHETTMMIVEELLSQNLVGKRLLDCGCGTGILSLVAKRCGVEHVTAYDIDEWSVENTKHNSELNDIELMDILLGDVSVLSHVDGMFDVIVANINRNILLADLPAIAETLSPDGIIILSGFYEEDIPMLTEKASTLGLYEVKRKVTNKWSMLELHR